MIDETINKPAEDIKKSGFRWVVLVLIFIVYSIATADRANLGVALPYIKKEFGMSNSEAGALLGLFFTFFAIAQTPLGFLFKAASTRIIMPVAMLATSLSTWFFGTSSSMMIMKFCRALLGLSEAPLGIGCGATINRWFPPKEKGTAVGLFYAAMKCGPVILPPICAIILVTYGWRMVFFACAVPGIILSVLWYVLVPDKPENSRFVSKTELKHIYSEEVATEKKSQQPRKNYYPLWMDKVIRIKKLTPLDTISRVFLSWNIIGISIAFLCMCGIINTVLFWIPSYLVTEKHYGAISMGMMTSVPFIGAVLGNIVGGWLSDRLFNKRRKPLMLLSTVFTSMSMYSLIYAPDNAVLLAVMLFFTGFLLNLGYWTFVCYPMAMTTKEIYPVAYGFVNTGGAIGGALFPFLVGLILDNYNWDYTFMFLSACSVLALLVAYSITEPLPEGENPIT